MRTLIVTTHVGLLLLIALTASPLLADEAQVFVDRYLGAVDRIRSYDVSMRIDGLNYPNALRPEIKDNPATRTQLEIVRDVFATGLGRRIESQLEDEQFRGISVKEWGVATSAGNPQPNSISPRAQGLNYLDYFNPNCSGYFLSDILRSDQVKVRLLSSPDAAQVARLNISHPDLKGPIRVWLDAEHGYLPRRIDKYVRTNEDKMQLRSRTEIQSFLLTDNDVWVPTQGAHIEYIPAGPTVGRAYSGFAIAVDAVKSSWNSIDSPDLFMPQRLPSVNGEELGWKQHLAPALVEAAQRRQDLRDKIRGSLESRSSRFMFIGINILIIALLLAFYIWKKHNRRPVTTA